MSKTRLSRPYISAITKKLLILSVIIIVFNLAILYLVGWGMNRDWPAAVFLAFLPLATFGFFIIKNRKKGNFLDILAHCKYHYIVPFVFYYDNTRVPGNRINIQEIKAVLQPCDVLLRRYDYYVDGIIFSENSYFTHAGICYRENDTKPLQVLHSTGERGVHPLAIEEFCNCDDIAVLRFSFDHSPKEIQMEEYIIREDRPALDEKAIESRELSVYKDLLSRVKPRSELKSEDKTEEHCEGYSSIILDRAASLIDVKYDFEFEFDNFDRLSCIEYVWYCFKCLFPLHRIRVKDFEFFGIFRFPVIVPDVFIRNDFFSVIHCSLSEVDNQAGLATKKRQLIKYVDRPKREFEWFLFKMYLWNLIFLVAAYFITDVTDVYLSSLRSQLQNFFHSSN